MQNIEVLTLCRFPNNFSLKLQ